MVILRYPTDRIPPGFPYIFASNYRNTENLKKNHKCRTMGAILSRWIPRKVPLSLVFSSHTHSPKVTRSIFRGIPLKSVAKLLFT